MSCKVPAAGTISCLRLYKKMPVGVTALLSFTFARQPTPKLEAAAAASVQNCAFRWSCHDSPCLLDGRPLWCRGSGDHGSTTYAPGPRPNGHPRNSREPAASSQSSPSKVTEQTGMTLHDRHDRRGSRDEVGWRR